LDRLVDPIVAPPLLDRFRLAWDWLLDLAISRTGLVCSIGWHRALKRQPIGRSARNASAYEERSRGSTNGGIDDGLDRHDHGGRENDWPRDLAGTVEAA
jgi:hypothetical protein